MCRVNRYLQQRFSKHQTSEPTLYGQDPVFEEHTIVFTVNQELRSDFILELSSTV